MDFVDFREPLKQGNEILIRISVESVLFDIRDSTFNKEHKISAPF